MTEKQPEKAPPKPLLNKKKFAGYVGVSGTVYAFATGILTSDMVLNWASTAVQNQIVQAGFFYMAGQWLNNLMIKRNFGKFQSEVLDSINNFSDSMKLSLTEVADALRADLAKKVSREEMQAEFDKTNKRLDALEIKK